MRSLIIVDIDDILHDMNRSLRECGVDHGVHYESHDVTNWEFVINHFGLDLLKRIVADIFHADEHYVYEDAPHALNRLIDAGYDIHYFTDRHTDFTEATHEWLIRHGFPQSDNLHVCHDKRLEIAALGFENIAAMIDDRPRTMIWALHVAGIPDVFALRCPYNQNLSDIENVHLAGDWRELEEKLVNTLKPVAASELLHESNPEKNINE